MLFNKKSDNKISLASGWKVEVKTEDATILEEQRNIGCAHFRKLGNNGASRRRLLTPATCRKKINPYHVDRVKNRTSGHPKNRLEGVSWKITVDIIPFHLGCQILEVKVIILRNS